MSENDRGPVLRYDILSEHHGTSSLFCQMLSESAMVSVFRSVGNGRSAGDDNREKVDLVLQAGGALSWGQHPGTNGTSLTSPINSGAHASSNGTGVTPRISPIYANHNLDSKASAGGVLQTATHSPTYKNATQQAAAFSPQRPLGASPISPRSRAQDHSERIGNRNVNGSGNGNRGSPRSSPRRTRLVNTSGGKKKGEREKERSSHSGRSGRKGAARSAPVVPSRPRPRPSPQQPSERQQQRSPRGSGNGNANGKESQSQSSRVLPRDQYISKNRGPSKSGTVNRRRVRR